MAAIRCTSSPHCNVSSAIRKCRESRRRMTDIVGVGALAEQGKGAGSPPQAVEAEQRGKVDLSEFMAKPELLTPPEDEE